MCGQVFKIPVKERVKRRSEDFTEGNVGFLCFVVNFVPTKFFGLPDSYLVEFHGQFRYVILSSLYFDTCSCNIRVITFFLTLLFRVDSQLSKETYRKNEKKGLEKGVTCIIKFIFSLKIKNLRGRIGAQGILISQTNPTSVNTVYVLDHSVGEEVLPGYPHVFRKDPF